MGFFIPKKQKQLMRERRRKKRLFLTSGNAESLDPTTSSSPTKNEAKKRSLSSDSTVNMSATVTENSTIMIPSHLSAKEAKKFRKDARRKAREQGLDESLLVFETEQISSKPPPRKKPKTSFPSIKELVEQEKKQKEQQQKELERKLEDETLSVSYKSRYVALDCEMVGIGTSGRQSVLARVSITDWEGNELLDTFVKVPSRVTDFRTHVSGVKPKHLKENAMEVEECRTTVAKILKGKVLVGHGLKNDLHALLLQHPKQDIRDTSKYRPFQKLINKKWRPRKLRDLVKEHLGKAIQVEGESHDSLDDARATMELFQLVRKEWETELEEISSRRRKD